MERKEALSSQGPATDGLTKLKHAGQYSDEERWDAAQHLAPDTTLLKSNLVHK